MIVNLPIEKVKTVNPYAYERLQEAVEQAKKYPKFKEGNWMFGVVLVSLPLEKVDNLVRVQTQGFDKLDPSTAVGKSWEPDPMWMYSVPQLIKRGFPPQMGI